jgi:hypothetical protein
VNRQRKEKLKVLLDQLSSCEHEQIFLLIKKDTSDFTSSESGVFVSADSISDECFQKIEEYTSFCFEQKKMIHEGEVKREEYSKLVNKN